MVHLRIAENMIFFQPFELDITCCTHPLANAGRGFRLLFGNKLLIRYPRYPDMDIDTIQQRPGNLARVVRISFGVQVHSCCESP